MAIFVSDNNKVTFLYESGTWAVPSGTSGNWIGLVTNHELTESENIIEVRYTGTASRNVGQLINGPKDYEGTITYHPQEFRLFAFALGSCYDAGSPSPYTHSISELNSDNGYAYTSGATQLTNFASFTIYDGKKGLSDGNHLTRKVNGCVIDSLSLSASNGEVVECEISYKAQTSTTGSKSTDLVNTVDEDTSRPYIWSDIIFHLPSGTKVNEVNELTFTIENNVENRHYVNGSKMTQALVPTQRDYSLELTMDVNSTWGKTLDEFYTNGSTFNTMIEMNISAGSEDAFFILSGCKITEFALPSANEGIDELSVTIKPQSCVINVDDLKQRYNPW